MNEKILQEFTVRIAKSKTQLRDVNQQCDKLRTEAAQLEKELEHLTNEKRLAERREEDLKVSFINKKVSNEEENEKNQYRKENLTMLRMKKKQLERERDGVAKENERAVMELQQLSREREKLEGQAKALSGKLELSASERSQAEEELQRNQEIVAERSKHLQKLKMEMENMKLLVSSTFQDELQISR
mmetsp:Transcript_30232/g.34335  ORF Transcript_30232/g.34335 Transcript_30232/m.34335 type:complete len:187 (-) Transcript_30232:122-682(-)